MNCIGVLFGYFTNKIFNHINFSISIDYYKYHNIYSSVDGHLGCFHVLAIVNSAAMNIGVHVSFQIMVFSGYMPGNGIAGSYGSSSFNLYGNTDDPK